MIIFIHSFLFKIAVFINIDLKWKRFKERNFFPQQSYLTFDSRRIGRDRS